MFVRIFKSRVVRRRRHIHDVHAPSVKFPADRLEHIPVPLIIRKYNKRDAVGIYFYFLPSAQNKPYFHEPPFQKIVQSPDNPDQDRKEHAPGPRVNVKPHILLPLSFVALPASTAISHI